MPFSCYPKEIQKKCAEYGKKLDLSGNDRDENSWGFLVNEGTQFTIYTYESITEEDLELMLEILR